MIINNIISNILFIVLIILSISIYEYNKKYFTKEKKFLLFAIITFLTYFKRLTIKQSF